MSSAQDTANPPLDFLHGGPGFFRFYTQRAPRVRGTFRALRWSIEAMWDDLAAQPARGRAGAKVPVFFFLGRKDHWVPPGDQRRVLGGAEGPVQRAALVRAVRSWAVR